MGIQDRDYFREDSKRRAQLTSRKPTGRARQLLAPTRRRQKINPWLWVLFACATGVFLGLTYKHLIR